MRASGPATAKASDDAVTPIVAAIDDLHNGRPEVSGLPCTCSIQPLALDRRSFLQNALTKAFPYVDTHQIESAVHDAIMWLLRDPHRFDPNRSSLGTFLATVARRRLLDRLKSDRRRSAREQLARRELARVSDSPNGPDDVTRRPEAVDLKVAARLPQELRALELLVRGGSVADFIEAMQIPRNGDESTELRLVVKRMRARVRYRRLKGDSDAASQIRRCLES